MYIVLIFNTENVICYSLIYKHEQYVNYVKYE